MDFRLSEDLLRLRSQICELVRTELAPHDNAIERTGRIPDGAIRSLQRAGMFGLNTPPAYGGRGLSMLGTCIALQELAKCHIAFYYLAGVNVHIGSKGIEFAGTEEQKRRWLPELASGRIIGAFALTEPEAGSDAAGITTTARRDGDSYVLNGRKLFITNAPVAGIFTIYAKTDFTAGRAGISAFLVEAGTPGLEIGEPMEMLAGNGAGHAELILTDCRVPARNLLGAEGQGFDLAMRCLDIGRVTWSAYCVGAAEHLLELAIDRVQKRQQFGRPLIANQGIEWQIADMYASLHSARLVSREAAWLYDEPGTDRRAASALAKLVGAEMVCKIADTTLQLFGGLGYSKQSAVERIWREVRVVRILDGTSEIMRRIVARYALSVASPC